MKTLVVIPAYNERENIVNVVENLIQNYPQYDYVIVNDGSMDDTSGLCKQRGYNLLDLPINLGLAGAFQTGLKYAEQNNYDFAVQFDADGQHRAEYIQILLEAAEQGYDIVIGSRFVDKKKPRSLRMLGSALISFAIHLTTGKKINDPTSGMRMFNRRTIHEFASNLNYGPEPDTVSYIMRQNAKVMEVQVDMDERVAGESYFNLKRSIIYMLRMGTSILLIQWFRKKKESIYKDDLLEEINANKAGGAGR